MTEHISPGHGEKAGPGPQYRCPECASILDTYPASRKDGRPEGVCPNHGVVAAIYGDRDAILSLRT